MQNIKVNIPPHRQSYIWSCGAACLCACLWYWNVFSEREPELYSALHTTEEDGTLGSSIVEVARTYGLFADVAINLTLDQIKFLLNDGATVILSIQAYNKDKNKNYIKSYDDSHFVILVGMTDTKIILMDPSIAGTYGFLSHTEFENRWHDYADSEDDIKENHGAIIVNGNKPSSGKFIHVD